MKLFNMTNLSIFLIMIFAENTFSQANDSFELCGDQKTHPYYNPELKYKGGFWEVKNHFISQYKLNEFINLDNNYGIVTIQFVINCEGKIGRFETQSCDLNYKDSQVNSIIITHLLELTKQLNQWVVAKDENKLEVNSHAFLSFRIENGKITEILPK